MPPHSGGSFTPEIAMRSALTLIAASATCLAVFGLAACSRDESTTAGQGVDKAIADAKSQSEKAKVATEDAAKAMAAGASDAAITVKVNAALVADTRLKVMKVDVDTQDGRVRLMGVAPDAAARDQTTAVVKGIEGVKDVDNQLRVESKS